MGDADSHDYMKLMDDYAKLKDECDVYIEALDSYSSLEPGDYVGPNDVYTDLHEVAMGALIDGKKIRGAP